MNLVYCKTMKIPWLIESEWLLIGRVARWQYDFWQLCVSEQAQLLCATACMVPLPLLLLLPPIIAFRQQNWATEVDMCIHWKVFHFFCFWFVYIGASVRTHLRANKNPKYNKCTHRKGERESTDTYVYIVLRALWFPPHVIWLDGWLVGEWWKQHNTEW